MSDIKATVENRAQSYQTMLQDEGYGAKNPVWDESVNTWDITAKYDGVQVLIVLDADDPDFVRIMLPNFFDIQPEQLGTALLAMDQANRMCKGAKVYLNSKRDDSMVSVEFLDKGATMDGTTLTRYVRMAVKAAKFYVDFFREQALHA
jgi:hypothetical protein